jgi:hypothetical protein
MSVEHVMSRARDPIEVTVGEHDYIYYGLPPHLREDAEVEEELEDDGFEVDIGEPTMETMRPVLSEETQPMVPMPKLADSWDIDTAPFSALDIPVSTDSFIEPELPEDEPAADTEATDLSALIIDATDTEDFNNAGGDATTSEFKTLDLPPLDPASSGMSPMVLAPDPPSDMLDGWGAAEPEEEDDLSNTGITLIEAVSETGEYVIGDEAGMRLRALETRLKQFLELDDLTDALEVVEQILELEPEHGLALEARATCGEKLVKMYESKVGGNLGATPVVLLPPDQLVWQDLDHRAGFILSQVDGASRYQDILLILGMDRLDTMRILAQLVQDGVIGTP